MVHSAEQLAVAECVIAGEANVADFNFGAFLNLEDEDDGVAGRDAFIFRRDFGELVAMFAQQFFQNDFSFFDAGRDRTAFYREADFRSLKRSRMSDSEIEWMPS